MALCLKFGDSTSSTNDVTGLIYINAVTNYQRQFNGSISKHPLDSGVSISDHFVSENPIYNISGVISGVDIGAMPYQVRIDGQRPLNVNKQPDAVEIADSGSGILKYLPDIAKQWLTPTEPQVKVATQIMQDYSGQFLDIIKRIFTYISYNSQTKKYSNSVVLTTLYEMESNGSFSKSITNLVVTSFSVNEDADTSDGLYFDMTLEEARFVTIGRAEIPKNVSDAMKKAAQTKANKGKVDSTDKPLPVAPDPSGNSPDPTRLSTIGKRG